MLTFNGINHVPGPTISYVRELPRSNVERRAALPYRLRRVRVPPTPHSRMQRVWPTPRGIVFGPRSTTSIPKHCIVSCTIRVGASITHEDPPKFAVHANTNSPAHRMGRMHKTPSCSVHKILHWTCARSSLSDDAVGGGAMCVRAEESTHSCVQTLQICEKESPWQCGSRGRVAWGAKKFPVPPLALPFLAIIRVSVPRALATTMH